MGNKTRFVLVAVVGCGLGCAMGRDRGPYEASDPAVPASVAVQDRAPPLLSDRGSSSVPPRYGEPLLPVSGGTLLVTRDGRWAVMSDPGADVVRVVDLVALDSHRDVRLEPGDEPGRLAEDADGRVHVALRAGGAVASFDPEAGEPSRREVCAAPRGIAYDDELDALHVACAGGELVTLSPHGGEPTRRLDLDPDLRDVVVDGGRLYVSRFRSAEVLVVSRDGTVQDRFGHSELVLPRGDGEGAFGGSVAWRMIATPRGPLVSYQRVLVSQIEVSRPGAYGGSGSDGPGLHACTRPIMHGALALVSPAGFVPLRALTHATLPVDVAVSPDGADVALAFAGNISGAALFPSPPVAVYEAAGLDEVETFVCAAPTRSPGALGRVVAVHYDPDGRLLMQIASPPQLVVLGHGVAVGGTVPLGDRVPYDHGHFLFHASTRSTLACASCHPEGGDDGVVWTFGGTGGRRTQPLWGGVLETAPFHWDGLRATMREIVESTFMTQMGGAELGPDDITAFSHYLDALPPPPLGPASDPGAVERGRALFHSDVARCADCHAGPLGTDNLNHVVRERAMQTPALVGLLMRAPYMHDGCARDLREAVLACDAPAGHGGAAVLGDDALGDLVAYLETR